MPQRLGFRGFGHITVVLEGKKCKRKEWVPR
jgi:hypothetical protein